MTYRIILYIVVYGLSFRAIAAPLADAAPQGPAGHVRAATLSGGAIAGIAPAPFVDHFDQATIDAARWTVKTTGGGTAALSGDSFVSFNTPMGADVGFLHHNTPIDLSRSQTWMFCVRRITGNSLRDLIGLWGIADGFTPEAASSAALATELRVTAGLVDLGPTPSVRFTYRQATGGGLRQWDGEPANLWAASGVAADAVDAIRQGAGADWYVVGFQVDAEAQRIRLFSQHRAAASISDSAQGPKLVSLTDWVSFAEIGIGVADESLWLTIGDRDTTALSATYDLEWVRFEAADPVQGWTNARALSADPYALQQHTAYGTQFLPFDRGTVAVPAGAPGSWDENGHRKKHVILDSDGTYYMFREGFDAASESAIGLAWSTTPDGPWAPVAGNPIVPRTLLPGNGAAYDVITAPWAIKDIAEPDSQKLWRLFVTGEVRNSSTHRVFLFSAPAIIGPWTLVVGPGPDGSVLGESNAADWRNDGVNDALVWWDASNEQWTMLCGGIRTGKGWSVGHATSSDLINWTETAGNPIVTANQAAIQAWTSVSGATVSVPDGSAYSEDSVVIVRNSSTAENLGMSRIRRITGNDLELYHEIAGLGGVNSSRRITAIGSGSITPHALIQEATGSYRLYVTAFQPFIRAGGAFGNSELVGSLTASDPAGPWTWDHLGSTNVPPNIWNAVRAQENLALVNGPVVRTVVWSPPFQQTHIDSNYNGNTRPGFVARPLIDFDGDGDLDVLVAGGGAMNIYECPADPATSPWPRYVKFDLTGTGPSANGGVMFDVNRDGKPDLITGWKNPDGKYDMVWIESPADPLTGTWTKHVFDATDLSFPHDVILGDVDNDGNNDEVLIVTIQRAFFNGVKWYQIPTQDFSNLWVGTRVLQGTDSTATGIAVGDLDGDGLNDIVQNRFWFRAPVDPQTEFWPSVTYDPGQTATSNVQLADMNGDGRLDIVVAEGHSFQTANGLGDIEWWETPLDPTTQPWTRHQISQRKLDNPETLVVIDMDGDGDLDVVTGELAIGATPVTWFNSKSNLIIFENVDALTDSWIENIIASNINAAHQALVIDINGDGALDILSEGAGEPFVDWFENPTATVVEVALRAVDVDHPTSPEDGPLPAGIVSVCPGRNFFVEVWVSQVDGGANGIAGGSVDLLFDAATMTVSSIEHGSVFNDPSNPDIIAAGLVDDLGGTTLLTGTAVGPNWALLARVAFTVTGGGPFTLSLDHGGLAFVLGGGIPPLTDTAVDVSATLTVNVAVIDDGVACTNDTCDEITGVAVHTPIDASCDDVDICTTDVCDTVLGCVNSALIYDLDRTASVDISDFALFAPHFASFAGNPAYNPCADFYFDDVINAADVSFFGTAIGKPCEDASIVLPDALHLPPLGCPADPLGRLSAIEASEDAVSLEVSAVVLRAPSQIASSDVLPESQTSRIAVRSVFVAEVWVRMSGHAARGLTGGSLSLHVDPELAAPLSAKLDAGFGLFQGGEVDPSTGSVTDLAGATLHSDVAVREWARFASVEFVALRSGVCRLELSHGHMAFAQYSVGAIAPAAVTLTGAQITIEEAVKLRRRLRRGNR